MTDWLWPLLGGLLTAAAAGPLGALLLWRRMAYFGDSLAHASLFGVALALLLDLPMGASVVAVCLLAALLLSRLMTLPGHGADTWLTIMAYGGLSLALVMTAAQGGDAHVLEDYLFGNLLSLDAGQLGLMAAGLAAVGLLLWRLWPALVAMAIDEETAAVDGWPVRRLRPVLMLMLALVVAAGAKVMGVLLISALLVIPAAAARLVSRHPDQMARRAALFGMLAVLAGLGVGATTGWPVPALTVLAGLLLLGLTGLLRFRA